LKSQVSDFFFGKSDEELYIEDMYEEMKANHASGDYMLGTAPSTMSIYNE